MSHGSVTVPSSPLRLAMVRLLIAWGAGIIVGGWVGGMVVWLVAGGMALLAALIARWRRRADLIVTALTLIAVAALGAAWWGVRTGFAPANDLSRFVTADSRLVDLSGIIEGQPHHRVRPRGEMARFLYSPPSTSFIVRVDRWHGDDRSLAVRGKVLVHLPRFDDRLREGDRVRAGGWLRALEPPANPGEYDFAAAMARLGVDGQLQLKARDNWRRIEPVEQRRAWWSNWRMRLTDRVGRALRTDMADHCDPQAAALLDAILLGRRTGQLGDLGDAFRKTGLAHLLSISGLHVGILAAGVWGVVMLLTGRPGWPAVAAIVVIGLYLAIVPWRVPLVRAAFMTVVFCWAIAWGRRAGGISAMAAVGLMLLIWRPGDLFAPGFQLSFGIVAALILFTGRVSRWLSGRGEIDDPAGRPAGVARYLADYLAVNLVAFVTALPMVAYHFGLISPLAVVMSVLMLPVVAVLLWLGFAKILLSLLVPPAGAWLGVPLGGLAEWMVSLVRGGAGLPGAWVAVPQPSAAWAIGAAMVIVALLAGRFARRPWALVLCLAICGLWLMGPSIRTHTNLPPPGRPALRINMIALGDGSCHLLRSGGEVMMFDCGTSSYAGAGRRTIVPALRSMGVRRIDTLFISHADLDHFSATLDVADALAIGSIRTTPQLLAEADARPWSATGHLVSQLRDRRMAIQPVTQGWSASFGRSRVEALWPPGDRRFKHNNDSSLMLMIDVADRRVLLCGDAQTEAIGALLASPRDLAAEVLELPHHGSFIELSPQWVERVGPDILLQSTGSRRLRWDHWPGHLAGARRYITARHGMVEITIPPDGPVEVRTFAGRAAEFAGSASAQGLK